jgi:hypothetical protein
VVGSFDMNEKHYVNRHYDNLNGIELLTGPISHTIIHNEKYNKKIHLFGDIHVAADKFSCNNNATSTNAIYFPDYLEYYLGIEKNKIIDLYIELPYMHDKKVPIMIHGMLDNTRLHFKECFESLLEKTECQNKYPNVRFHAMDIRKYISTDSSKEPDISSFNKFWTMIHYHSESLLKDHSISFNLSNIKLRVSRARDNVEHIIDNLSSHDKYENNEILDNIYDSFYHSFDNVLDDISNTLNTINILLSIIEADTEFEKIEQKLREHKIHAEELRLEMIKIQSADENIKFIKKMMRTYIGDVNGIYTDMEDRFWKLINGSVKMRSNVSEFVRNNYKPNFTQSTKLYGGKNIKIDKRIDNYSLWIIENIMLDYGAAIMDIYLIGRIFKQFKRKSPGDIFAESADNIIIICGDFHIDNYINFFNKINSSIIYRTNIKCDDDDPPIKPEDRCIPMHNMKF